uniref:Transposase n=1 Tax=Ditylenchus dipsaci TaxID=166011 RepID=A0A915EKR6_9BILA
MLLSDEYPTYICLRSHMPEYQHLMIRHKKKTGGGFAKWVKILGGVLSVTQLASRSHQQVRRDVGVDEA